MAVFALTGHVTLVMPVPFITQKYKQYKNQYCVLDDRIEIIEVFPDYKCDTAIQKAENQSVLEGIRIHSKNLLQTYPLYASFIF